MNPNNSTTDSTDQFIEELIDASNFTDIRPEVREEIKKDLYRKLDDFILARMIAAFSEEDLKKFEELLDNNAPDEEIQQFGPTHIPDFTTFLTNVFIEFRSVYLGEVQTPIIVPPVLETEKNEQT